MKRERIVAVADALANLGYDGIVAFDKAEPEHGTLETLYEEFGTETYVKLLGIVATTEDFQLNGDARVSTEDDSEWHAERRVRIIQNGGIKS